MTAPPGVGVLAAPADGGAASRGAGRPPTRAADDELIVRVLFAQARRRRRRIRLTGSAIVAALAVAAAALGLAWPRHAPGRGGPEPADGTFWAPAIEELGPATGDSTCTGPGEYAFLSDDGRRVYISRTDTTLAELPAGARSRPAQLTLPAGWYLPGGFGIAVANGTVVQSEDARWPAHPVDLAAWNPRTGRVTVIGRALGAISAHTPRGAGHSLLAWMPAGCPITITNTVTLVSRTLRSPLGDGFVLGGSFSPDGRQLAVFANDSPEPGGQTASMAIASTITGAVRLVPGVRMTVGEDSDWGRWLPGGSRLVALANRTYLVTTATLAARPFRFTGSGQDVDYSATLIMPG